MRCALLAAATLAVLVPSAPRAISAQDADLDAIAEGLEEQVIAWRRDFHENPELSNREFRTARIVAEHLESLGMEVTTDVAHTGVVGVLTGGLPGPVVALRADMDALPVPERNDLPFRSEATGEYRGETVPVMHACGHDTHVAILMGVAEALAEMREELPGTVKFLFQPAEEGAPEGEEGGAELMVKEGVLLGPDVDVAFGLHIASQQDVGTITYRSGPLLASVQDFRIVLTGRQTHGASPWAGVDPIVTGSQIVMGLQTIVSRTLNITENPAIVTVGKFTGGVRSNIVPEQVEMLGTIRTFDPEQTETVHRRIREIATNIAESAGATAEVEIVRGYPVTWNDPELTARARPTLARVAGGGLVEGVPRTGAEDFSFLSRAVPGLYFWLGIRDPEVPVAEAAPNHSPLFRIDESALPLGVRAMAHLVMDYGSRQSPGE